jgi:hypothetical protein
MLSVKIDKLNQIAILEPDGPLSESDFRSAAKEIDSLIAESGRLKGIVIHAKSFPGWASFAALTSHLRFVKDHHKKVARVALATDSIAAHFAEFFATHFVSAEIRIFAYGDMDKAIQWVMEEETSHQT